MRDDYDPRAYQDDLDTHDDDTEDMREYVEDEDADRGDASKIKT